MKTIHVDVPNNEFSAIKQYCDALIVALSKATASLDGFNVDRYCIKDASGACIATTFTRYDHLREEPDKLPYGRLVCGRNAIEWPGYQEIETVQSEYQRIQFIQDPKNKDTCFSLDDTVQICGSYRAHYHEMVVHHTAQYLDEIKRVIWVGGGDSMLLHEIIKYPSLELVVGLELDQAFTRLCFKHFGTQPHWENERVQWWYGDAVKSLLMLPKDYFGSFDMVLVEVSETVHSQTVTEGLDVFGALKLLLSPNGILVKNELYFERMKEIFEQTVNLHFLDVPVLCSQALILGSNNIDFLARTPKDHGVDKLWTRHLNPLNESIDRFELIHDYFKNDTPDNQHCKPINDKEKEAAGQTTSPGVVMIVETEGATINLKETNVVNGRIARALKDEATVISTVSYESAELGAMHLFVLDKGIVAARTWPEHRYCAFDIHLWSSFEKHDHIKQSLNSAVGSTKSSSYRIVAGGMFGVSTWTNDEKKRGPRKSIPCHKDSEPKRETAAVDQDVINVAVEESLAFLQHTDAAVAVLCGEKTLVCESLMVAEQGDHVNRILPLWTCSTIKENNDFRRDGLERMLECEEEIFKTLEEFRSENKILRISALIIDTSAPYSMGRIVHKIFTNTRNRKNMLAEHILVMAPIVDGSQSWRRNFLERFRRDIIWYDPVFRAKVLINSTKSSLEMGFVSSGDLTFINHLVEVCIRIEQRFNGIESEIREIRGGLFNNASGEDLFPTNFFLPSDYDEASPLEQWMSQHHLGQQVVVQLEMQDRWVAGEKIYCDFQGRRRVPRFYYGSWGSRVLRATCPHFASRSTEEREVSNFGRKRHKCFSERP